MRPLLVDAKQAARLLGIGRTTLYELIGVGAITPMHIGRCVRFAIADLEGFVANGCMNDTEQRATVNQAPVGSRRRPAYGGRANGPTLRLFDPAG